MAHTHVFESDYFHLPSTNITTDVLACPCGAIASVGEGRPNLIWEPWSDGRITKLARQVHVRTSEARC